MPIKISSEDAEKLYNISTEHEKMDNGELRFRLKKADGTAYIRTEASGKGAWQYSHSHINVREIYIIQTGWIAYAQLISDKLEIDIFNEYELFTTQPGITHNIYLPENSVIHTVKYGKSLGNDRIVNEKAKELDKLTRCLTEEQIKEYGTKQIF